MSINVMDSIMRAAESLGIAYMTLPSGGGHDCQNMASYAETGKIFVPSRGGISHNPREATSK
jgi:beta-ureidopropionase / N-carbamoyl-L-amino-acid hydrolase